MGAPGTAARALLQAVRFVRKMRGGAQAHLVEANDGHAYVVKFVNNPQHRRILINEWIAAAILRHVAVPTPEVAAVGLSAGFIERNHDVYIQLGSDRVSPAPGLHFGSRFPLDPDSGIVYDFLPDPVLRRVQGLSGFCGAYVVDKWISNADARQAIYFRPGRAGSSGASRFAVQMIDNGHAFGGQEWRMVDALSAGIYFRRTVYDSVVSRRDLDPWLDQIASFPENVLRMASNAMPASWLDGDEQPVEDLVERLLRRRKRVAYLIDACHESQKNPFSNWQ